MHGHALRKEVLALRRAGYSYSHISEATDLSKSTLSDWLTDIPYTPNQETIDRVGKAIAAANARKTSIKIHSIEQIRSDAEQEVGIVNERDLFMFGLGLYLGEGSKTQDVVRIANADPRVIRLAMSWFRNLGVRDEQFMLRIHTYPDNNIETTLEFWVGATNLPLGQFSKPYIDARKNKLVRKAGKLPYGTAHLSVRSLGRKEFGVILARKIEAWTDQVSHSVA